MTTETTRSLVLERVFGATFRTVMKGPEGEEFVNTGVFLEVVPNRKIVTAALDRRGPRAAREDGVADQLGRIAQDPLT